jgi:hypothetical protein
MIPTRSSSLILGRSLIDNALGFFLAPCELQGAHAFNERAVAAIETASAMEGLQTASEYQLVANCIFIMFQELIALVFGLSISSRYSRVFRTRPHSHCSRPDCSDPKADMLDGSVRKA